MSVFDLPEPVASPRPTLTPSGPVRVASIQRTVERPQGPFQQLMGVVAGVPKTTLRRGSIVSLVGLCIVASLGAMTLSGAADSPSNAIPDDRMLLVQASTGLARTDVTAPARVESAPAVEPAAETPLVPDLPPPTISTVPTTVAPPVTAPPRILAKATVPETSAS